MSGALRNHDEHDLTLPSDSVREITPATTPALNSEQIAPSEDGWIAPPRRPHSQWRESRILTSPPTRAVLPNRWIRPRPRAPSRLITSVPIESDWAPIME